MVEEIKNNGQLLGIIIYADFKRAPGIEFFTASDFSQQLAYMKRPKDYFIEPHVHNEVIREVHYTQEVLFIKSGKLRVDFYDETKNYIVSKILSSGDIILLAAGGHGFKMLEETEMVEVKQGPYSGDGDKSRFEGIDPIKINIEPRKSNRSRP